mgnify:CR=1 FL=1
MPDCRGFETMNGTLKQLHQTPLQPAGLPLLVPVDFSGCSRSALIYASRLVEGTRTPLLLLHVIHDDVSKPGIYRNSDSHRLTCPIKDIAAEMLESMLTEIRDQEPELQTLQAPRTILIPGLPGQRIIEVAEREQAGMIIMGTHGRNGLAHLLQGSVAEYVTRYARVPVMTVKDDTMVPVSLNLGYLENSGVSGEI